jgi:hypothetical protein
VSDIFISVTGRQYFRFYVRRRRGAAAAGEAAAVGGQLRCPPKSRRDFRLPAFHPFLFRKEEADTLNAKGITAVRLQHNLYIPKKEIFSSKKCETP